MVYAPTAGPCGCGEMVDATDLKRNRVLARETGDAELLKFGEACSW